jgi:hypothetical protein
MLSREPNLGLPAVLLPRQHNSAVPQLSKFASPWPGARDDRSAGMLGKMFRGGGSAGECPEAYIALSPEGIGLLSGQRVLVCLGRRAMAVPPSESQEFHPDTLSQLHRLCRSYWQKLAARKKIDRQFRAIGLVLAIAVAVVGTANVFLPDTYYPDHLRSSRLSSINLIECGPEESLAMRCVLLGNL